MASNKTKLAVGIFVIAGLAIAMLAIFWLGMSNYLSTGNNYVTYFDESVQGLSHDSPVKYRGVGIGQVGGVSVAPDARLVEVTLTIDKEHEIRPDLNMVAQLKSVGITGIMFIELDQRKKGEGLIPDLSFDPPDPVIPTKASDIQVILDGVDEVIEKIGELDAKRISDEIASTVESFNKAIKGVQLDRLSEEIRQVFVGINTLMDTEKIDRIIGAADNAVASMNSLARNTDRTVTEVRKGVNELLAESERMIGQLTMSQVHLSQTLQNLEAASDRLKDFAGTISDQPSQLIFGTPPPPRRIGEERR